MIQLSLFPEEYSEPEKLLAYLLGLANSDPPQDEWRWRFYRLKDLILDRFGHPCGVDWQRITLKCRGCDGTGRWGYWRRDGGEPCHRCWETPGVYRVFYVRLLRFAIAGRVFHRPDGERYESVPGGYAPRFDGKIKHTAPPDRLALKAFAFLALLFDREMWSRLIRDEYMVPRELRFSFLEDERTFLVK